MALCRVCLAGDIKLLSLSSIYQVYEKLTNTELDVKTEYGMPSTVCYVCHWLLRKFHMFCEMARTSNRILQDLLQNGTEITHTEIKVQPMNVSLNLTVNPLEPWSIGNVADTPNTLVAVKDEQIYEDDQAETLEIELTSFKIESLGDEEVNDDSNKTGDVRESDSNVKADINMRLCYNCNICNKIFNKKHYLLKHLEIHTRVKAYSCNRCDKSFTTNRDLKVHNRIHTGEKSYSCNRCGKRCISNSELKVHMQVHTGEKPYSCNRCVKSFARACTLKKHMLVHTGEKPYSCHRCGKTFAQKYGLARHIMEVHSNEKPYSCNQCVKTFSSKRNLKNHILMHTGGYFCHECDKTFSQKINLKHHMLIHTGEKPYSCCRCDKAFSQKGNLNIHMRIHTGEKPYSCCRCYKTFTQKIHLTRHMRKHSGGNYLDVIYVNAADFAPHEPPTYDIDEVINMDMQQRDWHLKPE